jgi:hypothetical protein
VEIKKKVINQRLMDRRVDVLLAMREFCRGFFASCEINTGTPSKEK